MQSDEQREKVRREVRRLLKQGKPLPSEYGARIVDKTGPAWQIVSRGGIAFTCRCGHVAPLEEFCCTPVTGELPHTDIQCPKCGVAIRRRGTLNKQTLRYYDEINPVL